MCVEILEKNAFVYPSGLDNVGEANHRRDLLVHDHVPEVDDGVPFRPLSRNVNIAGVVALNPREKNLFTVA